MIILDSTGFILIPGAAGPIPPAPPEPIALVGEGLPEIVLGRTYRLAGGEEPFQPTAQLIDGETPDWLSCTIDGRDVTFFDTGA